MKKASRKTGPLIRLSDDIRAPGYRINMLDPENFTVAFLGEFGFYRKTIAKALGMSLSQVNRRLKFAEVDPAAYRRGEAVIGRMILRGVNQAGVPQLRQFAQGILSEHLKQLGWSAAGITPELPEKAAVRSAPVNLPVYDTPVAQPG